MGKNWHHTIGTICGKPFNLFINCLCTRLTFDHVPRCARNFRFEIESLNFINHSREHKRANIPITRKSKWFCGIVLCWLAIRRSHAIKAATMRAREREKNRNALKWVKKKSIYKWFRIKPDESSITIGNWHLVLPINGAKGSKNDRDLAHINSHLQSMCCVALQQRLHTKFR